MSINQGKEMNALYIITMRDSRAEKYLRNWSQLIKADVSVIGNKAYLFDNHALDRFLVTWRHSFAKIVIWDCWNKRHLSL